MNLSDTQPQISPCQWVTRSKAIELLGISAKTFDKYARLGAKAGGIDSRVGRSGRRKFSGREILRFWSEY